MVCTRESSAPQVELLAERRRIVGWASLSTRHCGTQTRPDLCSPPSPEVNDSAPLSSITARPTAAFQGGELHCGTVQAALELPALAPRSVLPFLAFDLGSPSQVQLAKIAHPRRRSVKQGSQFESAYEIPSQRVDCITPLGPSFTSHFRSIYSPALCVD